MKINGNLLWLAGIVVICFSLLTWQKVITEATYLTSTMLILGYYFGGTRAVLKQEQKEATNVTKGS